MAVQLEMGHLVALLIAFVGLVGGFGKVLLLQVEKRLDERFKTQEDSRKEAQKRWDEEFRKIEEMARKNEKDLMGLKVHLAENFVARPDYVQGQSRLELKIDGLATKFENTVLRIGATKGSQP